MNLASARVLLLCLSIKEEIMKFWGHPDWAGDSIRSIDQSPQPFVAGYKSYLFIITSSSRCATSVIYERFRFSYEFPRTDR